MEVLKECWQVLGQMAPYLLFGFLVAGILAIWVSPEWVERHLGGKGLWSILKASAFGVPLPLCSCSVIPVSVSLRSHGASRAATTAFLISTPQTGVDSIAVTYALMGGVVAFFRPLAALITGVIGGLFVSLFAGETRGKVETDAHCNHMAPVKNRYLHGLYHGFVALPKDIGLPLLFGVLIAGVATAFIPQGAFAPYLGGAFSVLLLMAAGVPVYVCATASVPIALGFIHLGASPGAAIAFLIAGPATNAATFTTIWKALGPKTAMTYLFTIALSAFSCGMLFDWLFPTIEWVMPALHHETMGQGWFYQGAAIVVVCLIGFSMLFGRQDENI